MWYCVHSTGTKNWQQSRTLSTLLEVREYMLHYDIVAAFSGYVLKSVAIMSFSFTIWFHCSESQWLLILNLRRTHFSLWSLCTGATQNTIRVAQVNWFILKKNELCWLKISLDNSTASFMPSHKCSRFP